MLLSLSLLYGIFCLVNSLPEEFYVSDENGERLSAEFRIRKLELSSASWELGDRSRVEASQLIHVQVEAPHGGYQLQWFHIRKGYIMVPLTGAEPWIKSWTLTSDDRYLESYMMLNPNETRKQMSLVVSSHDKSCLFLAFELSSNQQIVETTLLNVDKVVLTKKPPANVEYSSDSPAQFSSQVVVSSLENMELFVYFANSPLVEEAHLVYVMSNDNLHVTKIDGLTVYVDVVPLSSNYSQLTIHCTAQVTGLLLVSLILYEPNMPYELVTEIYPSGKSSWMDEFPEYLYFNVPQRFVYTKNDAMQIHKDQGEKSYVVGCLIASSNINPDRLELHKDGQKVDDKQVTKFRRIPGTYQLLYTIEGAMVLDAAGEYVCVYSTSWSDPLTVFSGQPVAVSHFSLIHVCKHNNIIKIKMSCSASGKPPPKHIAITKFDTSQEMKWPVPGNETQRDTDSGTIMKIVASDEIEINEDNNEDSVDGGWKRTVSYTCDASSQFDYASSSINLFDVVSSMDSC